MQTRFALRSNTVAALVAVTLPALCLAQSDPTANRARVTITKVKPEMLNEWLDLQKNEVMPALKKAGIVAGVAQNDADRLGSMNGTIARPNAQRSCFLPRSRPRSWASHAASITASTR